MSSSWQDALKAVGVQDKPKLPKRFYKNVNTRAEGAGLVVLLDGKPVRTPTRELVIWPNAKLADEVAQEWAAQGEFIALPTMPLTRLANAALSGVATRMDAVIQEIVRFAGADLTCYRANAPAELMAKQAGAFDPVLSWALQQFGEAFRVTDGLAHIAQSPALLARLNDYVAGLVGASALRLMALSTLTSLTGSALITLYYLDAKCSLEAAWAMAHVDEDYQISLWGEDDEAMKRRTARWSDMQAAANILK